METRKIAVSCFIGGVLCGAVAMLFAPAYWWLGLIAGFAGGYISYEFKAVVQAIPEALELTKGEIVQGITSTWNDFVSFWRRPHPFDCASILTYGIGVGLWLSVTHKYPALVGRISHDAQANPIIAIADVIVMGFFAIGMPVITLSMLLEIIATIGMHQYGINGWAAEADLVNDEKKIGVKGKSVLVFRNQNKRKS
jgi:hypothetical protein